ncbi:unnamed protein product [Blepharisma stoltei]|uniref:Phosphoglycerate mutase n=1 Tax=Blepharisma stoltei TaxID=1481888 RepID=A0AAU9JNF6_9CILI|nr:unnamed protein product [Blepharisma stoltei]
MDLYITRHGQTTGNVQRILQGQQGGELTPIGFEQATKLGNRLKNVRFHAIYSSDLNRCQQTLSQIILHHNYLSPILDPRLREKGAGELEGQPLGTTDKLAKQQGVNLRAFRPNGGEAWIDVMERAKEFFNDLCRNHMREESKEALKILVVSHGGWIMEFLNVIKQLKGQPPVYANISKNTALYVLRVRKSGKNLTVNIAVDNDISHLTPTKGKLKSVKSK